MAQGTLYVVSGPSGAGKGTLISRVLKKVPNCWLSVSMTSRKPRGSEVDGREYLFVDEDRFKRIAAKDGFVEWACVHGNYYGTPAAPIEEHLGAGYVCLLEIDVQGGFQVRKRYGEAHLVFIAPPSIEELERRLRARGTDSEQTIALRLANAKKEMDVSSSYDTVIVNDDLDRATDELVKVIQSTA